VEIKVQHAAKSLPNPVEGKLSLADDHRIPRLDIAVGETRGLGRRRESPQRFRKNVSIAPIAAFLSGSGLRPPDSFMSAVNEGMSKVRAIIFVARRDADGGARSGLRRADWRLSGPDPLATTFYT
jgi:hypothetical protein